MDVQIREATEGDVAGLARLLVEVNDLHVEALPHVFQRIEADESTVGELHEALSQEGSRIFVAEHAGALVGYVSLWSYQTPPFRIFVPRRVAEIDAVVVSRAYQRRGIGGALVRRAEAWAAEQGIEHIELVVHEFNATALALYEKLGYATLSRRMWRSLPYRSQTGARALSDS
jgi:ribosomal protein S18 acetylase RimI-like enzyme